MQHLVLKKLADGENNQFAMSKHDSNRSKEVSREHCNYQNQKQVEYQVSTLFLGKDGNFARFWRGDLEIRAFSAGCEVDPSSTIRGNEIVS